MSALLKALPRADGCEPLADRLQAVDWARVLNDLDAEGCAVIERLLTAQECVGVTALYEQPAAFRSRVVMARHGFGRGEYQYFNYPLPPIVAGLRTELYAWLAPLANRWNATMGLEMQYPDTHAEFLARCHSAGQRRATPLLLRYGAGDFNCLHQDLYGEQVFPLQATILLSQPERDFTGGEFVIAEQRPRRQSRVQVVPLCAGDAVIFAVRYRPVRSARGAYRVNLRHGVSRIRGGHRLTLGVVFHDAQ